MLNKAIGLLLILISIINLLYSLRSRKKSVSYFQFLMNQSIIGSLFGIMAGLLLIFGKGKLF